jgi:CP family cyanate transporter-like MFS transporter
VHGISRRIGPERAILAALLLLAVGCATRSYAGPAGLWVGTAAIGSGIAVGNVLLPAIARRDFAGSVPRATGFYSACMATAASTASGVAVPIAAVSDWRAALALWALPAVAVSVAWLPRALPRPVIEPEPDHGRARSPVGRRPTAWLVTAFMGLQSTCFYVLVTWLPTIERAAAVPAPVAGFHLFLFQVAGIAGGLSIPVLLRLGRDQRAGAVAASVPMLVATVGLLIAPSLVLVWALVAGLGQGASLVVALSLISLRGRSHLDTTRLSGMAQSLGYLLAATGPIAAGTLAERTGGWSASLALVAVLAAAQVVVGGLVGRDREAGRVSPA